MKITSSYDVQIVGVNKMLKSTVTVYQEALAFLIDIFNKEWDFLQTAPDKLNRKTWAERLIHTECAEVSSEN